jgi:Flp pilus assembly protein TadG
MDFVTAPARRRRVRRALGDDRGAALVEFAITMPVLVILLLGMFTGGLALHHKLELADAAREGARYGATVPEKQCDNNGCNGQTWAALVRSLTVERANGDLQTSGVCVALVSGPGSAPVAVDANHTAGGGTNGRCYVDNSVDTGKRVQVSVQRQDTIEWMVSSSTVNLASQATAKFEQ